MTKEIPAGIENGQPPSDKIKFLLSHSPLEHEDQIESVLKVLETSNKWLGFFPLHHAVHYTRNWQNIARMTPLSLPKRGTL